MSLVLVGSLQANVDASIFYNLKDQYFPQPHVPSKKFYYFFEEFE